VSRKRENEDIPFFEEKFSEGEIGVASRVGTPFSLLENVHGGIAHFNKYVAQQRY
jgi:hypothetical protein